MKATVVLKMVSMDRPVCVLRKVEAWTSPSGRRNATTVRSRRPSASERPPPWANRLNKVLRVTTFSSSSSAESLGERYDEALPPPPFIETRPWWSSPYDAQILRFAIPILLANLVLPLTNAVDTAVVGRLGVAHLSGVAVGHVPASLLFGCLSFFSILVTPYVAQNHAAGKDDKVSSYVAQILRSAATLGLVLGTILITQTDSIMNVLKPAAEVRPFAAAYLKVSGTVLAGSLSFICCAGVLRGLKDSSTILKASLVVAAVNAILDCIFVFGLGWSVSGAALATALSIYAGLGVVLHKLFLSGILQAEDFLKKPDFGVILPFIGEGFRLSLRSLLLMVMLSLGTILMSQHGPLVHTTYELCKQISYFTYMVYLALEQTVQTMGASALGANNLAEARGIINRVMQISFTITVALVGVLITFSTQVARFFTRDPTLIASFAKVGANFLAFMPLSAVVSVVDGALIGASRTQTVAFSQALGYSLAIIALLAFNRAGLLDITITWCIIRLGMLFNGLITAPSLFSSKSSPYGFSLLP